MTVNAYQIRWQNTSVHPNPSELSYYGRRKDDFRVSAHENALLPFLRKTGSANFGRYQTLGGAGRVSTSNMRQEYGGDKTSRNKTILISKLSEKAAVESFGKRCFRLSQGGRNSEWKRSEVQSRCCPSVPPGPRPTPAEDWRPGSMECRIYSTPAHVSTIRFSPLTLRQKNRCPNFLMLRVERTNEGCPVRQPHFECSGFALLQRWKSRC